MTDKEIAYRRFQEFCHGKYCRGNDVKPLSSEFYSRDFSEGYYGSHNLEFSSGRYFEIKNFSGKDYLEKIVLQSSIKSK